MCMLISSLDAKYALFILMSMFHILSLQKFTDTVRIFEGDGLLVKHKTLAEVQMSANTVKDTQ